MTLTNIILIIFVFFFISSTLPRVDYFYIDFSLSYSFAFSSRYSTCNHTTPYLVGSSL